jgi:hypothetical protein
MANLRNLNRRPAKPALNRGAVQLRARWALWALGGMASTSEVMEWTHVRARLHGPKANWHNCAARRALDRVADRLRRVPPYGAWLWRLKDTEC